MSIFELFLTACGLSMDAFAVSVTNGLCVRKGRVRGAFMCGIIFGLFHKQKARPPQEISIFYMFFKEE